ncbi:hypothetical protein J2Y00_005167 [Deinococcus soli (ex Cha et al. 2016)]|uniref:Uncharacterized protein n=1 Tax=Deinococcus soli (ex Cha et al. 2016) TaxID=1309411 RepID=A0AAE3XJM8_9DEIO|nr:hypothetical protein [Deinococcus soli (ex Cha et al. 2016)]
MKRCPKAVALLQVMMLINSENWMRRIDLVALRRLQRGRRTQCQYTPPETERSPKPDQSHDWRIFVSHVFRTFKGSLFEGRPTA